MIYNDRIYGKHEIKDQLVLDLIKTKEMQRIKRVNQNGAVCYLDPKYNISRFEHCLGVYLLLKRLNAPREEQVAGLIHDVGHTSFSHVFDYVFKENIDSQSYHENFHEKIVKNSEISKILKKNNIDVDYIINEKNFPLLERDIPELCADRADYLLRDSFVEGVINMEQVRFLSSSLAVVNNQIIMKSFDAAKKAACLFIHMTSNLYACPMQGGTYHVLADAINIALKKGLINEKDFFTTDEYLFNKLKNSNDKDILFKLSLLNKKTIMAGTKEDHDIFTRSKLRFIDPNYIENKEVKRLSENDKEFAQKLEKFKKMINKGYYVKINGGKRNYSVISETSS